MRRRRYMVFLEVIDADGYRRKELLYGQARKRRLAIKVAKKCFKKKTKTKTIHAVCGRKASEPLGFLPF